MFSRFSKKIVFRVDLNLGAFFGDVHFRWWMYIFLGFLYIEAFHDVYF